MPAQLSVRILLLALVVLIYCSSLLLFSDNTAGTADVMTDETLKVVALAEEKDHEVVIDLGSKTAGGGHPGFDWEEHDVLDDPQVIESVNADINAALEAGKQSSSKDKDTGSKQPALVDDELEENGTKSDSVDGTQNIPNTNIPEKNSDSETVNDEPSDDTGHTIYDQEESSEQDEEEILEFGGNHNNKEEVDYSNVEYQDVTPIDNPYDFMPLEFDNNLWEATPRQLSLESAADFPATKTKASPYIKDYKDVSGGTTNSSRVVCKGISCEKRANAVIVILCRNSELVAMRRTLRQFEE